MSVQKRWRSKLSFGSSQASNINHGCRPSCCRKNLSDLMLGQKSIHARCPNRSYNTLWWTLESNKFAERECWTDGKVLRRSRRKCILRSYCAVCPECQNDNLVLFHKQWKELIRIRWLAGCDWGRSHRSSAPYSFNRNKVWFGGPACHN